LAIMFSEKLWGKEHLEKLNLLFIAWLMKKLQ
jgi:hypothetical protein